MEPDTKKVQMPADPALHPAHVVAVRPDVDGTHVKRGEYVLSIETPKGSRNVVAPADGHVEVHVSLMQDVEPGTSLFSITRDAQAPTPEPAPEPREDPPTTPAEQDAPAPLSPAATAGHDDLAPAGQGRAAEADAIRPSAGSDKGLTTVQALFGLLCIGLAVLLPGLLFQITGTPIQWGTSTVLLAAGLLVALVILVWVLSKVRVLGGKNSALPVGAAAMLAVLSFGAGLYFPSVKSLQEAAAAPVFTSAKALVPSQISSYFLGEIVEVNQQDVLIALWIYDTKAHGFDAHFRTGSQYQTKSELNELRDYNRNLLLAKSASSTAPFDKLPYFERLPKSARQSVKEDLLAHDWDGICSRIDEFSAKSFEVPITDVKANREAFLLSAARLYARNDYLTAVALSGGFVDEETAVEIGEGKKSPLTCEDMWAISESKKLIQSSSDQSSSLACQKLRELTQCIANLEKKVADILPNAHQDGRKIDQSWTDEYLDAQGRFVFLRSKQ